MMVLYIAHQDSVRLTKATRSTKT